MCGRNLTAKAPSFTPNPGTIRVLPSRVFSRAYFAISMLVVLEGLKSAPALSLKLVLTGPGQRTLTVTSLPSCLNSSAIARGETGYIAF